MKMIATPQITQTVMQHTACIHLVIPLAERMHAFGRALDELFGVLSAQDISPVGSAFAHHLRMSPENFDFEIGFITATLVTAAGRVKPSCWPAQTVAHAVYTGPYEGLPAAWGEFVEWMNANELLQADDLWEHYVIGPHANPAPSAWRTELFRPLRN